MYQIGEPAEVEPADHDDLGSLLGLLTGAVGDLADDIEGGWDQVVDPITCGLKGVNPRTGEIGNCSPRERDRLETYKEAGEAVCEASQAPVIGSAIPEAEPESIAWVIAGQWTQETAKHAARGGLTVVGTAAKAASGVIVAATAVDATCRWVAP